MSVSSPPETTSDKHLAVDEVRETEEAPVTKAGCGILGRYPVISVLIFAAAGVGIGIGLSFWEPDDPETKSKLLKWIGLVGDLFIRALKCVVLPLVFINIVISVVDMMQIGQAGSIGWKTIAMYFMTTVIASIIGIISVVSFENLFKEGNFDMMKDASVTLGCNEDGAFLAEMADGSLMCTADFEDEDAIQFSFVDVNGNFATQSSGPADSISLSDTIYDGVFSKLITDNITNSFVEANFAAVVVFAIAFGVALSRIIARKGAHEKVYVMEFFKELDGIFITLINYIIKVTPFAVISLIINAIGSQDELTDAFSNVGYLVLSVMLGMLAHALIVHVGIYWLVTKRNPFHYLRFMIPAQTMAFACASSAATIPMTLKSVRSTGMVPDAVARFVVPLGATVNMDGSAIYFPCACIWLAVLNNVEVNASHYILLVLISTIGSAGTAPVPSAGLVLVITAYNTVFNASGTPEGFPFIVAIDWFLDRLQTVLNVTGDGVVCGMISHICPMENEAHLVEDAEPAKKTGSGSSSSSDEDVN